MGVHTPTIIKCDAIMLEIVKANVAKGKSETSGLYMTVSCDRELCVHGYHMYRGIWAAAVGEGLSCDREPRSSKTWHQERSVHMCTNTIGSYVCSCHTGYTLSTGGHKCLGTKYVT